jgi:hypothetical protein
MFFLFSGRDEKKILGEGGEKVEGV